MPVTIKDIAEELNLSTPTVSRILSGAENHRVAEITRQRVLETAQLRNYRPNAVARSLRSGRTGAIGFYTDHVYQTPNSFYATIIHSLQTACSARDLDLMLYGTFRNRSTSEIYDGLRDRRVDGLILHADSSDSLVERLSDSPLPVVAIADPLRKLPSVSCDDEAGMRNLAAHLTRLGYRRFVFVRPDKPFSSVERRWNALQNAVIQHNGEIQALSIELEAASSLLDTLDAIEQQSHEKLVVCCWNDVTAYSLLQAACARCWEIPAKMAITGFDGFGIQQLGAPYGPENGTISPTGALASIPFTPDISGAAIRTIYDRHGDQMWGRYGLNNALNLDKNWFASDVIGIDLGMALLSIENHQSGLIWDLMSKNPATIKAYKTVGLAVTKEAEPRPLRIAKNGEVLDDASGTWAVNNSGTGDDEQVTIAFGRGGDFPQYGVLTKRNGYLRLNVGGGWGGYVSLVPSFWANGQLVQGTAVTADWTVVNNNLEVTLQGERGGLKSKIKLVMLPPSKGALEARVEAQLSGDVKLDARPGEALKLVMLSSMHHSATQWDSSAAYVGTKKFEMPAEGWLVNVQAPVTAKKFGLLGGERDGKVKPTFRIEFDKDVPVAGWVTRMPEPQEGSVSLWASAQQVPKTYKYIMRVTGSAEVAE